MNCFDDDEAVFPSLFKGELLSQKRKRPLEEYLDKKEVVVDNTVNYPVKMRKPLKKIKENRRLPVSVKTFLSNPGKRDYLIHYDGTPVSVGGLVGKHLVICCFLVPLLEQDPYTNTCRALIAAYPQLRPKNFEMVMVAKMRPGFSEDEGVFSHFFSAFPCPAVPFDDPDSRDFICKSIGLIRSDDSMATLILSDKGVVLQKGGYFERYGADYFPFTAARLRALDEQDTILKLRLDPIERESYFWYRDGGDLEADKYILKTVSPSELEPVSLAGLLGCQSSDVLSKWGGSGAEQISVADLSRKKCVGLYLWYNGTYMRTLHHLQKQCLGLGYEFEVVLVLMPLMCEHDSFEDDVKLTLEGHKILSWWKMRYNDRTSRRLWRLGELAMCDRLMILDSDSESWELYGRAIASDFGIKAYPFTRKRIVDKEVYALKSLTLESLLGYSQDADSYVVAHEASSHTRRVHVSELKGKNILLYLDYPETKNQYVLKLLQRSYDRIKHVHTNSEVVFIPISESYISISSPPCSIPCLLLPTIKAESVIKQLFPDGGCHATIVALGEDGLIRSRDAYRQLDDGNIDDLFADTLRIDIMDDLVDHHINGSEVG